MTSPELALEGASSSRRRRPLTLATLDVAVARATAGAGLALVPQALPDIGKELGNMAGWWDVSLVPLLVLTLLLANVASLAKRFARQAHAGFLFAYLATALSWPFAVIDPALVPKPGIFIAGHLIVAAGSAVVAFGPYPAIPISLGLSALYGWIRVSPSGGSLPVLDAILEAVYGALLSLVIALVAAMVRRAVSDADRARRVATDRYASAMLEQATEVERVQVDAIVHDSVLTTLLAAARAQTAEEKARVAVMADNAIDHLRSAALAPDDAEYLGIGIVAVRLAASVQELLAGVPDSSVRIEVREHWSMPVTAADALLAATTQAVINSLQHAGEAARQVIVRDWPSDRRIAVVIADDGRGFDPASALAGGRIGLKLSILERMELAGGSATVTSAPGEGSTIVLQWPSSAPGRDTPAPASATSDGEELD